MVAARHTMVDCQVRPMGVTDERILAGMMDLPREAFVPVAYAALAYVDENLPLGAGQILDIETRTGIAPLSGRRCLMAPSILARLLDAAEVKPDEVALDVGCGSGYATALLAGLAAGVVGLESDAALADEAERLLVGLSVDNAAIVRGPLDLGYARQAPYDVILLNGAVRSIPPAIEAQLADGGRLLVVIRDSSGLGRATIVRRVDAGKATSRLTRQIVFDAAIPDLTDLATPAGFAF